MTANHARTVALWLALLLAGCSSEVITLRTMDGDELTPLHGGQQLQVFVVTSHECPIANAYAPVLAGLAEEWRRQRLALDLYLVFAGPDLTAAAAHQHATDYRLPGTVLLDPGHTLITALGASMTPEAIVRHQGQILYRGRIDDRWRALGARAQQARVHDLRDAVAAAHAGQVIAKSRTEVIGCALPEAR